MAAPAAAAGRKGGHFAGEILPRRSLLPAQRAPRALLLRTRRRELQAGREHGLRTAASTSHPWSKAQARLNGETKALLLCSPHQSL